MLSCRYERLRSICAVHIHPRKNELRPRRSYRSGMYLPWHFSMMKWRSVISPICGMWCVHTKYNSACLCKPATPTLNPGTSEIPIHTTRYFNKTSCAKRFNRHYTGYGQYLTSTIGSPAAYTWRMVPDTYVLIVRNMVGVLQTNISKYA